MKNPKNKGNSFERKISNLLSDRFKEYTELEKSFRRNTDSGSFFGGSNQYRIDSHGLENGCLGDIMCPENFKFTIECKHYKTAPNIMSLLSQYNKPWDTWINQSLQDSKNTNKDFLLIIKYNNVKEFVITNNKIDTKLQYKDYNIILLSELLEYDDLWFFEIKD